MTDNEDKAIATLESKFPHCKFSKHSDLSEAYLKVRLGKSDVDSLELKSIYSELIQIKSDTLENGQQYVNWIYLVVYNTEGDYLFTIVKNDDDILFFEDGIR